MGSFKRPYVDAVISSLAPSITIVCTTRALNSPTVSLLRTMSLPGTKGYVNLENAANQHCNSEFYHGLVMYLCGVEARTNRT